MRDTTEFVAESLLTFGEIPFHPLKSYTILEPSAGTGFLANYIKYFFKERIMQSIKNSLTIDCIELNKDKFDILSKDFPNSIHGDFLKLDITKKYDFIIAAPPFKGNTDLEHIMKMYDLLEDYGEIMSLTTPYWFTNNEPLQVKFREWLSDKPHKTKILPDMAFSERGKTVPTAIINIYKWRP
jgi:type I restriction-modification system DNA methylase subunit